MEAINAETVGAWFAGRLPDGWFTAAPEVTVDREEILVVGRIEEPAAAEGADAAALTAGRRARIERFREETRPERIRIADDVEHRTSRKVAWGVECGDERQIFTHLAVPVMTRLRMSERAVLDTLVGAGVARSRADALAWCVRLVRDHQREWIEQLREALVAVREARAAGPEPTS